MKFQNHYNTEEFPRRYEELPSLTPSMTIPDQSMSVGEIMRRFASGLPISGQKVPSFNEEEIPDMDRLDLSEKFDLVEENRNRIALMQKALQDQEDARQKKENERLEDQIDFEIINNDQDDDQQSSRSQTTNKSKNQQSKKDTKNQKNQDE